MRRVVGATFTILATLGAVVMLWEFRIALLLFVFSLVVSAAVEPVLEAWVRRGMKRGLAILLTYLLGLASLGLLLYFITPALLHELSSLTNSFAAAYENTLQVWPKGTPFQQMVAERLPPTSVLFQSLTGEQGAAVANALFGFAQNFASILSQAVIVLILSIYWSTDRVRFERLWLSVLPVRLRERARTIWRSIEKGVGAYVRSEFIQSLLAGLLLGVGYWVMGLAYPISLALIGSILWLIPWLGAVLAVILPIVVGWGISPLMSFAAGFFTLMVLLALEIVVEPRFFNRRRYSSLLVVIFVVLMANAFGLLGLITAPPLAAAVQIFFRNLLRLSSPSEAVDPSVQVALLQTRLEQVKQLMNEEEVPPEVSSLVTRLSELLEETNEHFQKSEDDSIKLGLPTRSVP